MTQWTEQPDGTWRRGLLTVGMMNWISTHRAWWWRFEDSDWRERDGYSTPEEAQAAADAWAREMLSKLRELEE